MAFPAAATLQELIVGDDLEGGGSDITGLFTMETEQPVFWSATHTQLTTKPKRYSIGIGGTKSVYVPNTSQAGFKDSQQQDITGWHWVLRYFRNGIEQTLIFALPATVGPIYLNDLIRENPTDPVTVAYQGVLTVDGVGPDGVGNVNSSGGGGGGGSSTLAGITDMSANARTFNAAANFAAMRTALGVVAPSAFMATVIDDTTAAGALTTLGFSAFVQTLIDDADASAFFTTLGVSTFVKTILDDTTAGGVLTTLGISAFVQTLLDDAAATNFLTTLGVSTYAKTLLDDADAAAARVTLGASTVGATVFTAADAAAARAAIGAASSVAIDWASITGKPTFATIATSASASDLTTGTLAVARAAAGTTLTVYKSGTWPARPTTRTDITVQWIGADPSPAIVTSGTGGMYVGDIRGKAGS